MEKMNCKDCGLELKGGEVVCEDCSEHPNAKEFKDAEDKFNEGLEYKRKGLHLDAERVFGEAFQIAKKLEENGSARAKCILAVMYLSGNGVPADDVQAWEYFTQAEEQGYPHSRAVEYKSLLNR